jgi:hypothetical protein
MKALVGLLFISLALCAAPAFAQAQVQEVGIEASRALIEAQGVTDLFEPIDDENSVEVRHAASGLTCHFFGDEWDVRLMTFDGLPRGEDVGCASQRTNRSITLYATRYAPPISTQQALDEAEAGIRDRFTDARPTPALLTMSTEGVPEQLIRHFLIILRDEQWMTSAYVARQGDWIVKLRYTQRAVDQDGLMQAQLEAGAIMALALLEIQD